MARQKRGSSNEKLFKIKEANQELRSQVRQLRKELHRALKELELIRDAVTEDLIIPHDVEPESVTCKFCSSSNISVMPVGIKTVYLCQDCHKKYTL